MDEIHPSSIISIYQKKKSCFDMEMDLTLSTKENIAKEKKKNVQEFIVDDKTLLKVGSEYVWIWVIIEPIDKVIIDIRISFERTMLVAERFLKDLVS
jgi:transposase-like protein